MSLVDCYSLYVQGIPLDATEDDLLEHFNNWGDVFEVCIPPPTPGHSYKFGFVRYREEESAYRAIQERNDTVLKNNRIRVCFSHKPRQSVRGNNHKRRANHEWRSSCEDKARVESLAKVYREVQKEGADLPPLDSLLREMKNEPNMLYQSSYITDWCADVDLDKLGTSFRNCLSVGIDSCKFPMREMNDRRHSITSQNEEAPPTLRSISQTTKLRGDVGIKAPQPTPPEKPFGRAKLLREALMKSPGKTQAS